MRFWLIVMLTAGCGSAGAAEVETVLPSGIRLTAVEVPFIPAQHRLVGCDRGNACLIDGHLAFGAIHVPKTQLQQVRLQTAQGATYSLDVSGMFNPSLEADLKQTWGGFCYDPANCTIRAVLSDAGGAYTAEWRVLDGHAFRTLISDSMDLVQFVRAHLQAPRYE